MKGSCQARCADTGRRCELPVHSSIVHARGSVRFVRVALPGQTIFPGLEKIDAAAGRQTATMEPDWGEDRPKHHQSILRQSHFQSQRQSKKDGAIPPQHVIDAQLADWTPLPVADVFRNCLGCERRLPDIDKWKRATCSEQCRKEWNAKKERESRAKRPPRKGTCAYCSTPFEMKRLGNPRVTCGPRCASALAIQRRWASRPQPQAAQEGT